VRAAFYATANGIGGVLYDSMSWAIVGTQAPPGLIYKAVQAGAAVSGVSEPSWPLTLGVQVNDGGVIWEAVQTARVVWEAAPLYVSGGAEPAWPTVAGGTVADGTIKWVAISRRIEDPKCPNSKVVAIAASKVFAGDKDIVRYCATANPLDWSSANDAGYLPTGLQQSGANDVAVLNLYRSNLVAMNASTFQMWQVDPDPASMSLLDSIDGIGSIYQLAAQAVGNDLFFLTPLGVRSVGIAANSTNLQAGDVGMPIDPLLRDLLATIAPGHATYYPAMGQYWLAFGSDVLVYTMGPPGQPGAWSRYLFPWAIDEFTLLGSTLFLRHGDTIAAIDETTYADADLFGDTGIEGVVQWPWLDLGLPGTTKRLTGVDLVAVGHVTIGVAVDQSQPLDSVPYTAAASVPADTLTGLLVPIPAAAPSFSFELKFDSPSPPLPGMCTPQWPPVYDHWEAQAMNIYIQDNRSST
jgi:hypothetical protein